MVLTEVEWSVPSGDAPSAEALQALEFAQRAAQDFDAAFQVRNPEREASIPTFDGDEVCISAEPMRLGSYTAEHELRTVRTIVDLESEGSFGTRAQEVRSRFAARSIDGHYAVKYLQRGIIDSEHACNATTEMILETKILMNLAPHPNISQVYGVNSAGIDSFLVYGRKSFFIITDRIESSLVERIAQWRTDEVAAQLPSSSQNSASSHSWENPERTRLHQRLEIAMDIASALVYLHSRNLVFYLRPDKIGFDTRYGRMKLCQFGQTRQEGMAAHPRSLTKSDNIDYLAYTGPEVFCKGPTTTATDVYAYGMLLWEFMSLERPFLGWDRAQHFQAVVRMDGRPEMPKPGSKGKCWPKGICDLARDCWDPHLRPSMKTVHGHLEMALLFEETEEDNLKEEYRELRQGQSTNAAKPERKENGEKVRGVTRSASDNSGSLNKLVLKGRPRRRKSHDDDTSFAGSFLSGSVATTATTVTTSRRSSPSVSRRKSSESRRSRRTSPETGPRRKKKSPGRNSDRGSSPDVSTATASSKRVSKKNGRSVSVRVNDSTASLLTALMESDDHGKPRRIPVRSSSGDFDGNSSMPVMDTSADFRNFESPRQPLTPQIRRKPSSRQGRGTIPHPLVHPKTPRNNSGGLKPGSTPRTPRRRYSTDGSGKSPRSPASPPRTPRRRHSTDGLSTSPGSPETPPAKAPRRRHSTDATGIPATPRQTPRHSKGASGRVSGRSAVPSTPRRDARRNNSDLTPRTRSSVERSPSADEALARAVGNVQISPRTPTTEEERRADRLAGIAGTKIGII